MTRQLPLLFVLSCASLLLPDAAQAEQVDNPAYTMWSAFEPGAAVTHQMTMTSSPMPDQQMQMTATVTLKSINPDELVIVRETTMAMNGMDQTMPPQEEVVPAKLEAGEVDPSLAALDDPDTEQGQETVTVDGQDLECTWYAIDVEQNGQATSGKVWISEQVPGGLVKMQTQSSGDQGDSTINVILQRFTAEGAS